MKQETIEQVAESLEQIWFDYESKEDFFTYDEDGVKFNYLKCCERRVICMGGALLSTFSLAPTQFYKEILIRGFELAMKNIETKMERETQLSFEDFCAFEASMLTFNQMKEDLAKSL